jgi:hypothetical protein
VVLKNHSALTELKGAAKATSSSQRAFRRGAALGGEVSIKQVNSLHGMDGEHGWALHRYLGQEVSLSAKTAPRS